MISDVFIKRPRLASVISVVIVLAGLLCISAMPIEQYPNIVPPSVAVTATYPGASADVVESSVAQQIESAVNGVEDMLYMNSTSNDDGSYSLTVTFNMFNPKWLPCCRYLWFLPPIPNMMIRF